MSAEVMLTLPSGEQVLQDGTVIDPNKPQMAATISREIVSGRAAAVLVDKVHRRLGDLPDTANRLNPICAVITYTAIGLSDADIAVALSTTVENVARLKDLDSYKQLTDMFDQTVFENERQQAKHIIAKHASRAAASMVSMIEDSDPNIALTASRDVLKISGVDTSDDRNKMPGGLRITIVKSDKQGSDSVSVTLGDEHGR